MPAVVGLLIAAHALSRWPLSIAELWTWQATGSDWSALLTQVSMDTHPPLHPMLVWFLRGVSDTEWAARLPSAAGALAAAGLLWATLRRQLDASWASLGALSLILAPVWVCYAGIARPYALLMTCGAALLYGASVLPEHPRRGAAILAAAGLLGLHLHYVAAAPIGAVLLAALATRWRAALSAAAVTVVGFLPWYLLVGRYHLGKTPWEPPTLAVLRSLVFEVQDLTSLAAVGVAALAAVGAVAAVWQRRWPLAALALGVVLMPLVLSTNQQVQLRLYAFTGLLPLVVLLAVHGARTLLPRPAVWLLAAVVFQAPEAWRLLRLPSSPFRNPGTDGGVHDSRQDMALLMALLPEGARLIVPPTVEPNVLAHYAPGAEVGGPAAPGDWELLERPRPHRGGPGCILNNAFARPLRLPDGESCARVLAALGEDERRIDWRLERALAEDGAEEKLAILGGARRDGWAVPELTQAHLLADTDPGAAQRLISAGLWEALQWSERDTARKLLRLRETLSPDEQASGLRAQQQCIAGATPHAWLLHRCRSQLTAWSVPRRPDRPGRKR